MSPCYYCNSKHHNIRQCNVDWRDFLWWDGMFDYEVGYMGEINCNNLWSLKKKTLMRIACLENVSRIQKITPDGRNLTCSLVNIKLNQEKEKLIDAIVDRYNKNKKEVEELRNKQSIDTSEECPICYDKLGDAVCTTKCGHKFCTDCFVQIIRRLPQGACCPMCRASLIPKQEDRQVEGRSERNMASYNRGQADRERDDRLRAHAAEESPVNISWSIDRNPDHESARRLFSEEDYMRTREGESVEDREEEEVGF
jgi:hypothetical protein